MSAKQRARLKAAQAQASRPVDAISSSEDSAESKSEVALPPKNSASRVLSFGALDASDTSSNESESDEKLISAEPAPIPEAVTTSSRKPSKKSKKKQKINSQQKDTLRVADFSSDVSVDLLGLVVEDNKTSAELAHLLAVDPKDLDVDGLMRERFAGADSALDRQAGARGGKTGKKVNKLGGSARFIFGYPKAEWPDAPSFAGGGVGMTTEQSGGAYSPGPYHGQPRFRFTWSEEYQKLNESYLVVQRSGDANRLVAFLSQHPYHLEGLLQLAMVFARTGVMDRAADLIRRCVYYLNASECEAFRPCSALCLLDPSRTENKAYFTAVFRHMQIVGMLGCPSISAATAKLLLSLDPYGDTCYTLLVLDFYLLSAGMASEVARIFSESPRFVLGYPSWSAQDVSYTLADLPNWNYSVALGRFLTDRKVGLFVNDKKSDSVEELSADLLLKKAIRKFPFFLKYIISESAISDAPIQHVPGSGSSAVSSRQWKDLFSNRLFRCSEHMDESAQSLAAHLGELYYVRSVSLWCNRQSSVGFVDVEKWIYCCATAVILELGANADEVSLP
jgi:hypothetical protein